LLVFLLSCNRSKKPDPQQSYRQVQLTFLRGDLGKATQQAEQGYQYYSGQSVEWAWQFRLLQAEILAYRRLSKEALSIVNAELPSDFAHGDLEIRKEMVKGLALARLGRNKEADQHLSEAQQLCERTNSSLAGELADINGVVAFGRNDFPDAEALFRKSLQSARQQKDELLEVTALLNLGSAALKQHHYDQSILWSTDAHQAAHKLGARFAEQKALGNLGWAYYRLGDIDKSVDFFQQAADEARSLNARSDLVKWLNSLGMISHDAGQLSVAEDYYKQSLALAQQSEDKEDLVDGMTAIAAVSVERKEWEQATKYSGQAITLCRADSDRAGELDAILVQGKIAVADKDVSRAAQLFREVAEDRSSEVPLKWEAENDLGRLYEDEHRITDAQQHYKTAIATFESARSSLRQEDFRLPFLTNGVQLYDDEIHLLVTQNAIGEALQVADYSRARTLAEGLGNSGTPHNSGPSVVRNAQNTAGKIGATILFYWLGPRYSYLWIVTPSRTTLVSLPSSSVINPLIRNYREELEGPRDVLETGARNGRNLFDILIAPASQEIAKTSRTIVISLTEL
jgi:tetratricopeptide (TPR) repeat protein